MNVSYDTAPKMKFSFKDFFSKCKQTANFFTFTKCILKLFSNKRFIIYQDLSQKYGIACESYFVG